MKKNKLLIVLLFTIMFLSCDKVKYFPDNPLTKTSTKIIAHKGGGNIDSGNTLKSCIYGLENADGIECDIQRSENNTIYLNHNAVVSACGKYEAQCFSTLPDKQILDIDSCLGPKINFTKLEEVFKYMSQNYPNKIISIDVKAWTPCGISNVNMIRQMNEMAQRIIELTEKYNLENRVLVESESGDFLYFIKMHTDNIETYLSTNGDFELGMARALNAKFSGISFKYNYLEKIEKEHIDMLHKKGLKIQLWTLDDSAEIKKAIALQPDYIQTDLINF